MMVVHAVDRKSSVSDGEPKRAHRNPMLFGLILTTACYSSFAAPR